MQQPQGDHLTGPEVRLRMFGDGAHLLIDLVEQCRDKIEGDHGLLRAWPGVMLSTSVEEVHDHDNKTIKYYRVSLVCQRLTPLVTIASVNCARRLTSATTWPGAPRHWARRARQASGGSWMRS